MIRKILLLALSLLLVIPLVHSTRNPTTTSVPPIPPQSAGVQLQCSPPQVFPGSVNPGDSGFIRVRCPDKNGFIQFGQKGVPSTSLTPTFTLGLGYVNASIILAGSAGNPCNLNFRTITIGNFTVATGSLLNRTITFGNPPTSNSQLLATNYDYCLQYFNAPSIGLAGFDIVWT